MSYAVNMLSTSRAESRAENIPSSYPSIFYPKKMT